MTSAYRLVPVEDVLPRNRLARVISIGAERTTRAAFARVRAENAELYPSDQRRPATRADCLEGGQNAHRPCPWVSCRHHLALHVLKGGAVAVTVPGATPEDVITGLAETCALDVAERGPMELEDIGELLHLSKERVRQVEDVAMRKARRMAAREHPDEEIEIVRVARCAGCGRELVSKRRRAEHDAQWCSRYCEQISARKKRAEATRQNERTATP